jgi:prophage regulatory protein
MIRKVSCSTVVSLPDVAREELAGVSEIAEMLGVSRPSAARYVERSDFPAPAGELSRGRVWRRSDVQAWGKKHLPLPPGRPRKPAA